DRLWRGYCKLGDVFLFCAPDRPLRLWQQMGTSSANLSGIRRSEPCVCVCLSAHYAHAFCTPVSRACTSTRDVRRAVCERDPFCSGHPLSCFGGLASS